MRQLTLIFLQILSELVQVQYVSGKITYSIRVLFTLLYVHFFKPVLWVLSSNRLTASLWLLPHVHVIYQVMEARVNTQESPSTHQSKVNLLPLCCCISGSYTCSPLVVAAQQHPWLPGKLRVHVGDTCRSSSSSRLHSPNKLLFFDFSAANCELLHM